MQARTYMSDWTKGEIAAICGALDRITSRPPAGARLWSARPPDATQRKQRSPTAKRQSNPTESRTADNRALTLFALGSAWSRSSAGLGR